MFPSSVTGSWEDSLGQFSTRWEEGCVSLCWPLLRQAHAWVTYLFLFVWFRAINHARVSQSPMCGSPDAFLPHSEVQPGGSASLTALMELTKWIQGSLHLSLPICNTGHWKNLSIGKKSDSAQFLAKIKADHLFLEKANLIETKQNKTHVQ